MQTRSLSTALRENNGAAVSANVNSIAISGAQQIVSPGAALSQGLAPEADGMSGTVNCDAAGCTYNMYMISGFTYNGSIRSTDEGGGKKVVADLTIKGTTTAGGSGTQTIDWRISGTLTVTPTLINGSLSSNGTGSISGAQSFSYVYTNLVQYNNVAIDATGTPTGGSIYARWSIQVNGMSQGAQAWEGTVTFPR